ncbi:hypothetical protein [Phyllobacterium sp. SB3]|uniref:hypothetical protein n=1 Tax=Phyllobacterium sp. SB3 TaxID=3156073 RepID=UPI0032AF84D6
MLSIMDFVKAKLERRDEDSFWMPVTVLLGVIAGIALLIKATQNPHGIPDDARMFLSWMGRIENPDILKGDLIADYWSSVSPWLYDALYRLGWTAGIKPLTFVLFFPPFLYPPMAFFAYRLLRSFGVEPIITFVVVAVLVHLLARGDLVPSGTPRALWPLLTLMVLDGLSRRMIWQTAIGQLLLTGSYPQMALVTSGIIGLSAITPWQNPWMDLSKRRIAIILVAAAATIAGILPFTLGTNEFAPIMNLAEARDIPTFRATGRGAVFSPDGSIEYFCSQRTGIFSDRCDGISDPKIIWLIFWYFSGPLLLFLGLFKTSRPDMPRSALPAYLVIVSLGLATVATVMMFKLHIPSRYTSFFLILPYFGTLPLLLAWIRNVTLPIVMRNWPRWRGAMTVSFFGLLAGAIGLAADVKLQIRYPANPSLIAAISALPEKAVVGGFVRDLDFSPVLTNRSTLFSRELTIAYQRGYFMPTLERMQAVRDIVLTNDPKLLSDRIRTLKLDHLIIEEDTLANQRVPASFRGFFSADLTTIEASAKASGPSLVTQLAPRCTSGTYGPVHMLDTACILRQITPN